MQKLFYLISFSFLLFLFAFQACSEKPKFIPDLELISHDSLARRGAYLVMVGGCDDCHSPKRFGPQGPELIPELRLSGYPSGRPVQKPDTSVMSKGWALMSADLTFAAGPWGQSFAANITSDGTGIGNWSEEQFRRAIVQGKWKGLEGSRPLMPPMPWQNLRNLDSLDITAIYTFLKTTKPVENVVPAYRPPGEL